MTDTLSPDLQDFMQNLGRKLAAGASAVATMDWKARVDAINDVDKVLQILAARVRYLTNDEDDREALFRGMVGVNAVALHLLRHRDDILAKRQAEIDAEQEVV